MVRNAPFTASVLAGGPGSGRVDLEIMGMSFRGTAAVREGFQTVSERLGTLLDSPAGRPLRADDDAPRLDDVATGGKLAGYRTLAQ